MATIKILLRDKQNKAGLYPIVLRITKDRKIKIITLGMDCLKKDWDEKEAQFKKSYSNYIQRNRVLLNIKQKALTLIDGFNLDDFDFTLVQFETKLRGKEQSKITVLEYWEEKVQDLNLAGRTGNAKAYQDTKNSFFRFCKNQKIMFREITVEVHQKKTDWLGNQYIISTPINTPKSNYKPSNVSVDNIIENKRQQLSLQNPSSVTGDWNQDRLNNNEVIEFFSDPFRGRYPNSPAYNIGNLLGANLYDGPSTKYKIIEVLNHYDQVKVIDKKGDWLLVYTLNGNLGCVKSNLLKRY